MDRRSEAGRLQLQARKHLAMSGTASIGYYLGCPVWASAGWVGRLYAPKSPRRAWLAEYAAVFNTVEGNSTFYAVPALDTVRRWCDETPDGFRFALKFPRVVSHEYELVECGRDLQPFLDALAVLAERDRLGPSFLQLGPQFHGGKLPQLNQFVRSLPREYPYAVEVRHRDYFDEGNTERQLDDLLQGLQVDRVLFDSRPLFSAKPSDESERGAQGRKPQSPLRRTVSGQRPMLRLIGRNDATAVLPWIDEWVEHVAVWVREGLQPYVFTHAPDDTFAPDLAKLFHERLRQRMPDLPPLPPWGSERAAMKNAVRNTPQQRELF